MAARDAGLRRLPVEAQRKRIGRRTAFAKRLLHADRRGLQRDAVGREIREECGMHALLASHAGECKLGIDERAECHLVGIGLVRHRFKCQEQAPGADAERR